MDRATEEGKTEVAVEAVEEGRGEVLNSPAGSKRRAGSQSGGGTNGSMHWADWTVQLRSWAETCAAREETRGD